MERKRWRGEGGEEEVERRRWRGDPFPQPSSLQADLTSRPRDLLQNATFKEDLEKKKKKKSSSLN